MDRIALGKTGLKVSIMGLGCGGHSKLGLATGGDLDNAVRVVRAALDLDINFIDTAEAYGTEEAVGKAIAEVKRDEVILSTKKSTWGGEMTADDIETSLHASLTRLGTDYVDLYHLHGLQLEQYGTAREEWLPRLLDLQQQGKIRFLGVTETFEKDPGHKMLQRALQDKEWQVVMAGFNILNQCARKRVFPVTQENGVGALIMFAVRNAFSRRERLDEILLDLRKEELIAGDSLDAEGLQELVREGGAEDLVDAAYRFCRYEPGAEVILSGTGSVEHLKANAKSLEKDDLAPALRQRLASIFRYVDHLTGG